jgi:hypothetical protein
MYRFRLDRYPIVVVEQSRSHTDAEFDRYLRALERLIDTGGPYAMIDVFPENVSVPDMTRIKRFAEWYGAHRVAAEAACVLSVSVIPSAAMRGAAKFFVRLVGGRVAQTFARDEAEAFALCEAKLGMSLSRVTRATIPPGIADIV